MVDALLQRIIMYAYNTVPYYKNFFTSQHIDPTSIKCASDLEMLPLVGKKQIQESRQDFYSLEFNYNNDTKGELMMQQTSGSTGEPFNVLWAKRDYTSSMFHHWKYRSMNYGVDASHRFCSFQHYGKNRTPVIEFRNECREISMNKNFISDENIRTYYEHMLYFKPDWLFIQSSLAYVLAGFIKENSLKVPPSIRYIELIGEHVFESYRHYIHEVFGDCFSNMYGCTETNGIAYECRNGKFHILKNNVIVEVLDNGVPVGYGKEGDVHVTSLCNTAMPFIRYSLGDRAVLYPGDICSCGCRDTILELVAGRLGELFFAGGDGSYKSCRIIYPVQKVNFSNIPGRNIYIEFQLDKIRNNEYTFSFIKNNRVDMSGSMKESFLLEIEKMGFKGFKWNICLIDNPYPNLHRGVYFPIQ